MGESLLSEWIGYYTCFVYKAFQNLAPYPNKINSDKITSIEQRTLFGGARSLCKINLKHIIFAQASSAGDPATSGVNLGYTSRVILLEPEPVS